MRVVAATLSALLLAACATTATGGSQALTDTLTLVPVASNLSSPVYLASPPGDTHRLFVVEQAGRIRIIEDGQLLTTPFLDIRDSVASGGEEGLLSVAFHPSYPNTPYFYVDYTHQRGGTLYTLIERYSVSADSNVADRTTHKLILQIVQPYSNHNGGLVVFGPDGMLYIGMGDGGSEGDPQNRAQNPDSLLGKLLRIDVDGGDPYAIPTGNPYAAGGGRGEIWAIGLRNPWRYAFDPPTGLLYTADVGQDIMEEVDVEPASQRGVNYGWRIMEGTDCYSPATGCNSSGLVLPAVEYTHADGCSIIGGYVYRGAMSPALAGQYFYSDYCSAWVRSFTYSGGKVTTQTNWTLKVSLGSVLSFGQDALGEQYVLTAGGEIYRLAAP